MFLRRILLIGGLLAIAHGVQAAQVFVENTPWKYFKGVSEASTPVSDWRQINFNDSSWLTGNAPFYYENNSGYSGNTELTDMEGSYICIFMRKTFEVANVASDIELQLETRADDGCVVWINGVEVLRFNMVGGELSYTQGADGSIGDDNISASTAITNASDILVAGTNVIAIQAFNRTLSGSSDYLIAASLTSSLDTQPPVVTTLIPPATATVRDLFQIEVMFDEPVTNVNASDLLINGIPAEELIFGGPDQFLFVFTTPPTGRVDVAWAPGNGITDVTSSLNPFSGGSWFYTLDPNAEPPGIIISEFMASNDQTLNDDDGDSSDWIELFNAGDVSGSLNGWYLTDDPLDLTKWRIPSVTLLPRSYMLVYASGKNRAVPTAPLHANFQLTSGGEYLALVDDLTNVVSEFAPTYPEQFTDISYGRDRANPSVLGYFETPTPGSQNTPGGSGFAPEVQFSRPAGTFTSSFNLSLSVTSVTAVIRYTLNNTIPTQGSPIYSSPLPISGTTRVRTRAFEPGLLPGVVRSEHYIRLDSSVTSVSSDLPLMILHNFGGGGVPTSGEQFVVMQIFEPKSGRSRLVNPADLSTRGRFRKRGSSTQGIAKASFAFEAWDEFNDDTDIAPLGMPPESDWVLYAPNQYDPVLIHNSFMYELSRDLGPYASRTRFVEVYLKDNSGTPGSITSSDYNGIYLIIEKVKRDKNRVDIDNLEVEHSAPPELTGGYLLKIDRADPGDGGFSAAGQTVRYVDPKEEEIELPQRDPQQNYIRDYITAFGSALNGANFQDPELGYAPFVNVPSFIDHHLLNVLSENADAFRLSTYFFKPRNAPLEFGPIWDFDRSLESKSDNRDDNPSVWHDGGTDFFNYTWWGRLLQDPNFWQAWIDRWQELQEGPMSIEALHAKIDRMADEVRESQVREQGRWASITGPRGSYQNEVNIMKNWLAARLIFINSEFLERPTFNHPGGDIPAGLEIIMAAPEGGTIYYNLDGEDPRGFDGNPSASAQVYSGPITIGANSRLIARAFDSSHSNLSGGDNPRVSSSWSGKREGLFVVARPSLIISEIMYHPAQAPFGSPYNEEDYEFVEVKNVGGAPLNLNRVRFVNGIQFDFSGGNILLLQPGERAVVVKNEAAFVSRYGAGLPVVGQYTGSLDNGGERIELVGRVGEEIHDFSYNDKWYPVTDGEGFSLVIVDEQAARDAWDRKSGWRISTALNGTPGEEDGAPAGTPQVVVNEALTHTDLPQIDAIELFNAGPTNASVAGWFLTDDLADPRKYVIPPGTAIPANGYWVVYETDFNVNPGQEDSFLLSSKGEVIYLFSGDGVNLTGYAQGFEFGAAENGVSFGRHTISSGQDQFPAQRFNTLDGPNAGPRVGPVVISEIMYHPPGPGEQNFEYVELSNLEGVPVNLFDPAFPTNTWRLNDAVDYRFPMNQVLPGGGKVLVVGFDPTTNTIALAQFRFAYGLGAGTAIYGPFEGRLNNSSDNLELQRPDSPEPPPDPDAGFVPFITVDRVQYTDNAPWPSAADGVGSSLQRVVANTYGNDPIHWVAAAPTADANYPGGTPPVIVTQPVSQTVIASSDVLFTVDVSGSGPFRFQWRFNGSNIEGATNSFLSLSRVQAGQAGSYEVVVLNAANSAASDIASLTIFTAATVTRQPVSETVLPGANVTFTVQATSNTPITYQWRKDGVPLPGETGTALNLTNVQEEDDGFYDVAITDGVGTTFSNEARLAVLINPVVVKLPASLTVAEGAQAILSVQSRGTLPMSYRWRHNAATVTNLILFSHISFFTIPSAQLSDAGAYDVVLTNAAFFQPGILTRPAAQLTVLTDTDGDGMADDYENANGLNPNDPGDGALDLDGDGMTNAEENLSGTDPGDPTSFMKIDGISLENGVRIEFLARAGRTYTVQYRDTLGGLIWMDLEDVAAELTDQTVVLIDNQGSANRYYRLVTPRVAR